MNTTIFTTLSTDDFKSLIKNCIKEEMASFQPGENHSSLNSDMMTMKDLAKRLGVSKPTIIKWTKDGQLLARRIGRRVFYKKEDVERCLKSYEGTLASEMRMATAYRRWKSPI